MQPVGVLLLRHGTGRRLTRWAGMTAEDILLYVGAFQTAWISLLNDEDVQLDNIETLPALLMAAILEVAANGERDEDQLTVSGLRRLADLRLAAGTEAPSANTH